MHIKHSVEAKVSMALVGLTILTGFILCNMGSDGTVVADASAATNGTASASVTVADACSMAVSGNNGVAGEDGYTYSTTVNNGTTQVVTANSVMVSCNDYAGFKIYAIGYSGDTLGSTDMIASTSNDYNIKTDASGTYGSYWKMKLTKANSINTTILSAYTSFNVIPDDYTLVAQYASNTGNTANTASMITPSYQVYVGSAQPAGTYTGKVKYTLVHPTSAAAPIIPPTYMQNTTAVAAKVPNIGDTATVVDARDGTLYRVGRLADGNIWMLENLALDLTSSTVKTAMRNSTDTKTNASYASINKLFNGGGTTSDKYPTAKLNNVAWTSSSQNYYSIPMMVKSGTCNNAYCVNGGTAGSPWSYADSTTATINGTTSRVQGKIGIYYNYCAASAGSYCYGNGTSQGTSSGNATEDICPAGWHMPSGDTAKGSYYYLYNTGYRANYNNFVDALSTPLSGYFYSGKADNQGNLGFFWSSTRYDNYSMYSLRVNSSDVRPRSLNDRNYGRSVRCVVGS